MMLRNHYRKSLNRIFVLFVFLFSANRIIAQQEIPDNIKEQILNGITALESAKVPADIDEALTLFEEAILLAPKYPDAHYFLGKTLSLMQGNSGKAVKEFKKYLEMLPEALDKEKVSGEIAQLEEAIKIKNKFYLMGLSLIKLSDGIYIRQVSPDFIAMPVKISGPYKRVKLVFAGDKIEKIGEKTITDEYSIQDIFSLIEKDSSEDNYINIELKRGGKSSTVFILKGNKYNTTYVSNLGEEDLTSIIDDSKKPVVVIFISDWCKPCEDYNPKIYEYASRYEETASFIVANVDESTYLSKEFDISIIPSIYFYKTGKLVDKMLGYDKELFDEKVKELINN